MSISYIKTNNNISIVFDDGYSVTVNSDYMYYQQIEDAIKADKPLLVRKLSTPLMALKGALTRYSENIGIVGSELYYRGEVIDNVLTSRIMEMIADGYDVTPMILFMENLMMNPSENSRNELYDFMEASGMPITNDGYLLAYKNVNANFTDIRTGKMDNSPGSVVEMLREECDDNRNRTCSSGLHFCGKNYLTSYSVGENGRTVLVKINPADVVSIPTDYNNQKGRACKYEILLEIDANENDITDSLIWDEHDDIATIENWWDEDDDFLAALDDYDAMQHDLRNSEFEKARVKENRELFDNTSNSKDINPIKKSWIDGIFGGGLPDYMKPKDEK